MQQQQQYQQQQQQQQQPFNPNAYAYSQQQLNSGFSFMQAPQNVSTAPAMASSPFDP
jgi:hypothetical protein